MRHIYDYDFMAIGAHADDVEISCGGSIAKMVAQNKKGLIVDMCDASAATRGSAEQRKNEAINAAKVLGIDKRLNLGLKDAHLVLNEESVKKMLIAIRTYRPKLLITHCADDFHTDHNITHQIVKEAWYKAGLKSLYPELEVFRPHRLVYYIGGQEHPVDFAVDISEFYELKMDSLACYKSQFAVAGSEEFKGNTYISSNAFLEDLKIRHQAMGKRILKSKAEGFLMHNLPEVKCLGDLDGEMY